MSTESLAAAVHESVPELDSGRITQCMLITLDTLAEHLDDAMGLYIAKSLPKDAADALRSGARRANTTGQTIKLTAFIDKIRTRTELPPEQAEALTYAVAITLAHQLGAERTAALSHALPKDLDRLFKE